MKYRKLGNTDLDVSLIGLGTMTYGEQNSEADAHAQLDLALELGVNLVDTAEMYPVPPMATTQGLTEHYIGTWLAKTGRRKDIILASKIAGPQRDPKRPGHIRNGGTKYLRVNSTGTEAVASGTDSIAVGTNAQFDKFCRQVVMRPDIVEDPRYATNVERARNRLTLLPVVTGLIREFPRDLLLARLTECGIPCGEVLGLHEALTGPRTRRGGLVQELPHPVAGSTHVYAPPYRLDGQRLPIRHAPPTLGEGTRDVLQRLLQMSDAQLEALQAQGVLTLPGDGRAD